MTTDVDATPAFTVGELVAFIEAHSIPDDAVVWMQRDGLDGGEDWQDTSVGASVEISTRGGQSLHLWYS